MDAQNKENADKIYREGVCPVLDELTNEIMKIDATTFRLGSDAELARNASELESMSRAVSAYMGLLKQEPKYREYLFNRKSKNGTATWGDKVLTQLDRLSAVSEYYRLRRIVIEDEYYINNANEEIPLQEKKGDTTAVRHLKGNLRASAMAASDQYVRSIENERYMQPPLWLQNALTLDPEEIKKKKDNKDAGFTGGSPASDFPMVSKYVRESGHRPLYDKIFKMGKEKTKTNTWGKSPKFLGGDETLNKITISDDWSRAMNAYASEYSYRRTDEEMLEMMDILSIQMDEEKWKEIGKDPEAVAFYESAYKEMLMKNVSMILSSAKRMTQTISVKLLSMHSADLVQQMTIGVRSVIMNNAIITKEPRIN